MGGGWTAARGVPLGRRPVSYGTKPFTPAAADGATDRRTLRRHCWVSMPGVPDEIEGLVVQWAKDDQHQWVALTQYVLDEPSGPRAVLEWLPAGRLRPR